MAFYAKGNAKESFVSTVSFRCAPTGRGYQEIPRLQNLDNHEATREFTPTGSTSPARGATLNQRDLINHNRDELYESRKLTCPSCGEMNEALTDMEQRLAKIERNMMANIETRVANVEGSLERKVADLEDEVEAVSNKVTGLETAFIKAFDEMKDVLIKIEDKEGESARNVRNTPSGDRENIIVAGGSGTNSVEMFNWRQKIWSPLESMPLVRFGAISFVHDNHVTIAGGFGPGNINDDMIRMDIHPNPDPAVDWSDCPVELPTKLAHHASVLYDDRLIVSGGFNRDGVSDGIYEVQLVPPYTVKTLSRMPEPRQFHSMQILRDSLLIFGGRTTKSHEDSLSSVVLYDMKTREWKQLAPLPYEVNKMATVKWGDNVLIIGGADNLRNALDKVLMYNIDTERTIELPAMTYKRRDCTAVAIGNNIVVLGGTDERWRPLKSVEVFNFESYSWQELPGMSVGRYWHTAVVV